MWDTRDDLVARVLDAAAGMNDSMDQLRRTASDLHTRVTRCVEVGSGIFDYLS